MYVPISKKSDRLILLLFLAKIESLLYHYLNKYPILFNFGHKFVFWDHCAKFLSKTIIVYIFEKPSLIINQTDFSFFLPFFIPNIVHKFRNWYQCAAA